MMKAKFTLVGLLFALTISVKGQPYVADKIVGVVGKTSILYSEVEEQYMQMHSQGESIERCAVFEDLLAQKLLVTQAAIDSIEISEAEVELELEQRLTYFINQIGTEEKLIEYFGKSIYEIKEDMRDAVREQSLTRKMQGEIIRDLTITPAEVKAFYKDLNSDSIPIIESEIQLSQIVLYPKSNQNAIFEVKEKLLKLRERVLNGESFSTMAILYSEGPSSKMGGDIGWAAKSDLDPAYSKAAFTLKKGQVSKIVESSFGYHLIQLMDKTDDRIKTRHILMKPKVAIDTKVATQRKLDSISQLIRIDSISFERAAIRFSQDPDTRLSGGSRVNPATLNTKFRVEEFSTSEYYIIRKLKIGEMSTPFESTDSKGKTIYKIVQLKSRSEPHKANLKEDFDLLKNAALQDKQSKTLDKWITEKAKDVYIKIEAPYNDCSFKISHWKR